MSYELQSNDPFEKAAYAKLLRAQARLQKAQEKYLAERDAAASVKAEEMEDLGRRQDAAESR